MEVVWKEEINQFEELHKRKASTESTIQAAFRVTSIYPFNPNVIKNEQMKPAEATSVKAGFPLLQLSPVHAVMAAFHHNPPATFNIDPNTFVAAGPPLIIPHLDLTSLQFSDQDLEKILQQNLGLTNQHIVAQDGIIESRRKRRRNTVLHCPWAVLVVILQHLSGLRKLKKHREQRIGRPHGLQRTLWRRYGKR
ncbi:hypothetical protein K438DRAFT_1843418 [Mycena galopus ATCC 62051]|nr:hypothetical protein K438DRAFT_1843418 [Mycena galopus ATCC 62051]